MNGATTNTDQDLFHVPIKRIPHFIDHVFKTYGANWKPLILLSLMQFVTTLGAILAIMLVVAVEHYGRFSKIAGYIPGFYLPKSQMGSGTTAATGDGYGRMRFLEEDDLKDFFENFGVELIIGIVLFFLAVNFISTIYRGAFIHATAEIKIGERPNVFKSIRFSWSMKWNLYVLQLLFDAAVFGIILIFVGIPAAVAFLGNKDMDASDIAVGMSWMFIGMMVVLLLVFLIRDCMFIGSFPAAVIEKTSATGAFRRSWNLCKIDFGTIVVTRFLFSILLQIPMVIVSAVAESIPHGDILKDCANIALLPLQLILPAIVYISIRASNENYTREDLSQELIGIGQVTSADIELPDYEKQNANVDFGPSI